MSLVYDRSLSLKLALVADANYSGARYIPLDQAPAEPGNAPAPYLRQMHAIANSIPCGMTVMSRHPFNAAAWETVC